MEMAVIKFDARNIVTITICGALGYVLLCGINMALQRVRSMGGGA